MTHLAELPADAQSGWTDEPETGNVEEYRILRLGSDQQWDEARQQLLSDLRGPENPTKLAEVAEKTAENRLQQFSPAWSRWMWQRLMNHHKWAQEWCESTVLLTFTGRTTLPEANSPMPPVTHCERIRASREARNTALSRAMDDVEQWNAITVVGVHRTGHCHVHTGIWADESVTSERFEPVIHSHLNNCRVATREGHGTGAITVRSDSAGLTGELGKNAPGLDTRGDSGHGVLSEPDHRQFGATVLDVGGWDAVRF